MQIGVLSDIHGNYIALKRCLDYLMERKVDQYIFLGDYIGEFAYPEKTMALLYEMMENYECHFIKGNKENYWMNYRDAGEVGWYYGDSTTGSLKAAYDHLSDKDLDFFASLKPFQNLTYDGFPQITICHGSPNKVNDKMIPDEHTYQVMERDPSSIILCGHTHIMRTIAWKEKFSYNPGSTGLSFFGDGKAQFMILHGEDGSWKPEFISLSYDIEQVIKELYESGLDHIAPCWTQITMSALRGGNVTHGEVLKYAMKLCQEETGGCIWPNIEEKFWKQAVKEKINS